MALSICTETLIRLFAVLLKYMIQHFFIVLIIIALGVFIKRGAIGNIIIGGLGVLSQLVGDITFIGGILSSGFVGIIWALLVFRSDAPWYIKYPGIPAAAMLGLLLELIPFSFGAPTGLFTFLMSVGGIASIVLIILGAPLYLAFLGIPGIKDGVCWLTNLGLKIL